MYPAARRLIGSIRNRGARPLLYLTWGRRDGWPETGMPTYASMQSAIDDGYLAIAADQRVAIAQVGYAWDTLVTREASASLWQQDGSHPSEAGTYLAACIFYATIFRESPTGLRAPRTRVENFRDLWQHPQSSRRQRKARVLGNRRGRFVLDEQPHLSRRPCRDHTGHVRRLLGSRLAERVLVHGPGVHLHAGQRHDLHQ